MFIVDGRIIFIISYVVSLRFSQQCWWSFSSSGMLHHVICFEMLVIIYRSEWCNIHEHQDLHQHCWENLQSCVVWLYREATCCFSWTAWTWRWMHCASTKVHLVLSLWCNMSEDLNLQFLRLLALTFHKCTLQHGMWRWLRNIVAGFCVLWQHLLREMMKIMKSLSLMVDVIWGKTWSQNVYLCVMFSGNNTVIHFRPVG